MRATAFIFPVGNEKVYMKIRIICIVIVVIILCTGCQPNNDGNYVLSKSENSTIQTLCQYNNLTYTPTETSILDKDVKEAVNAKLMTSSEMCPVEARNNVMIGDNIYVDYIVSYQNKVISVNSDVKISVGEGAFDVDFENQMVNAERGVCVSFDYLVKDPTHALYNQIVQIEATVTQIYVVETPVLTDEYISKHFGVATVEDFEKMVVKSLEDAREAEDRVRNAYALLKKVCEGSAFIINRSELDSTRETVINNHVQIAYLYDLSPNEYVSQKLCLNESEYADYCTQEAITMIEMRLVIEEIVKLENYSISDDELYEYANNKGYTQLDILKSTQLKKELEYEIYRNKVYDFLLSHSISQ